MVGEGGEERKLYYYYYYFSFSIWEEADGS